MSKMLRITALALALGAVALPVYADDKAAVPAVPADPVVATVNGDAIHRSDIAHELQGLGPQAQQIPLDKIYPQLLQKLIVTKLVAAQGYAANLQNSKEVKDRLKAAEVQMVADAYVSSTITPKITDEKIKARYDELAAKYKPEDEVKASHILVKTEAEANDIIKQLKSGGDFAKIAADKSIDTSSMKQGGDLGYFKRGDMVPQFSDAAFGMKTGEVSDKPVKTSFGYHVIKVEDRRKSAAPPLADVKDQITNQIGQELVAQMVKDLQAKAKIEKFNPDGTPMKEKTNATKDKSDKSDADSDKK